MLVFGCATPIGELPEGSSTGVAAKIPGELPEELQVLEYPELDLSPLSETVCLDGRTLEPMSVVELIERARTADVVLIGEYHGQEEGLAASAALWQALVKRYEGEDKEEAGGLASSKEVANETGPTLALEFIERDEQLELDDWLAAEELTEPEDFSFAHGAMLLESKRAGRPVIAANAPRRYVRMARTRGYDHLRAMTATQRATFVLPGDGDVPEPSAGYRDRFFELFGGGGGHEGGMTLEQIESFWRAQIVWDATMADSVVRGLSSGDCPVVLVVGRFHTAYDGGIPQVLRALRPDAEVFSVVMAREDEIEELKTELQTPPIGDAVWVLRELPSVKPES
ncbi:MAG: ChaN family lipoprotein [Planctomycetota bacterium]